MARQMRVQYTIKGHNNPDGTPVERNRWYGDVDTLAKGELGRLLKYLPSEIAGLADAWVECREVGDWKRIDLEDSGDDPKQP